MMNNMKLQWLLLVLLLPTTFYAQSEALLDKAIQQYNREHYTKAEIIIDKLLKKDETFDQAYLWKAKCLVQFEEFETAHQQLQIAINLQPTKASYRLAMGNLKFQVGQSSLMKPEGCDACGQAILPTAGNDIKPIHYFEAASKDYQKAIALDADFGAAYYHLALTYQALGKQDKACQQFQKAKDLDYALAKEAWEAGCND